MFGGSVYFFNMTFQDLKLQVNGSDGEIINALPSAPYTPSISRAYQRTISSEPGTFGLKNQIQFAGCNQPFYKVQIGINVSHVPVTQDILIYCFNQYAVVTIVAGGNNYIVKNGETIEVE